MISTRFEVRFNFREVAFRNPCCESLKKDLDDEAMTELLFSFIGVSLIVPGFSVVKLFRFTERRPGNDFNDYRERT